VRVVAAIPVVGLLAGCGLGVAFPDAPQPPLIAAFVVVAILALVLHASRRTRPFAAVAALVFCAGGFLLACRAWQHAWRAPVRVAFESIARTQRGHAAAQGRPADVESANVVLVGRLLADALPTAGGAYSLSVGSEWIGALASGHGAFGAAANPVSGGVWLTVGGELARSVAGEWRAGRRIRVPAQVRRASTYLDPDVPNQERVLARRGIALVGSVKSGSLVEIVARGSPVEETAAALRAFARRAIADGVGRWSSRAAAIVTAIVIGDRSGLETDVQTRLQEAGTYHVIAISGGNIAILAATALALFRLAGLLGRAAALTAMVLLIAYGLVVGGSASVDRATLMAVVFLAGRMLDLRGPPANVLLVVAGVLVLQNPLAVADPSFLLTFGATAALLVVAGAERVSARGWLMNTAVGMLAASFAAETALLPIAAWFFARVTFAGLALNFAAIPLMAVAQLAGMLVVPLFLVSARVAAIAGWIAAAGAEGLVRSADLVAWMPGVTWRVAPPSAKAIAAYYLACAAALWVWRRGPPAKNASLVGSRLAPPAIRFGRQPAAGALSPRYRAASLAVACLCGFWVACHPWPRWRGDGRLHVTFLDVGQGDAIFARFPGGGSLLVDAGGLASGGSFDVGDRVVAPALRRQNLRRLGTQALTQGDADHIGGAGAIVREFRPWDVWEGVPVPPFVPLQTLSAAARVASSRWATLQTGDHLSIDGVSVVVHHPAPPDWERQDVRNDDSIVLELRWRDLSVVLTGDTGRAVEERIAARFAPAPLRVLKVPHHGSATSSSEAFLRALSPQAAVISVGRGNPYGHPASVVLQRYQEIGTQIFRTDQDGAIELMSDGYRAQVATFTGKRVMLTSRKHEGPKP
jgi:competence protein ComEC